MCKCNHGTIYLFDLFYIAAGFSDVLFCFQREDSTNAQRLSDLTSEVMHSLSHTYHHISDLMVDWTAPPPRQLRAPPAAPTAAIIQQTIPVQVLG